ncbi:MAG: ribulose-phosphate 3-epimerase [Defluviitaleaceae bacterium]|nr:ribulose-phosphate 3-epimerase [Defluviitaleaceae bacterium]MCL2240494.1 ribulose-phosphate 3-epimerase [Defluviitaleaceae bacterium]
MKLHPSIMCADYGNLENEIKLLTGAGIDYFHVDVMDGSFVPNFACGTEVFKCLKHFSHIPVDAHLMIHSPAQHIDFFHRLGADMITIHAEADPHAARTLARIKDMGLIPGLAINPGTSIETVKELLPLCGHVLAMTVNPGFAGQAFLPFTVGKIKDLCALAVYHGFTLCLDGAMTPDKIREMHALGVEAFVLGTKAMFYKDVSRRNYAATVRELRNIQ